MNTIWQYLKSSEKDEYIKFLEIFGSMSGLFKNTDAGANANKPYLYYRNHEQLFAKVFDVQDLTRKDSAFDVIAKVNDERIGVGLKTWIHTSDKTFQKVAEFNKVAPIEFAPLIEDKDYTNLIYKVAKLRNERIQLDQRLYNTNYDIYHNITRDDNVMNIVETSYDLIQLDNLNLLQQNGKSYSFTDGFNNYKFYASKSVLLKEFAADQSNIVKRIPIHQYKDPFELLRSINVDMPIQNDKYEVIFLPIYSDRNFRVEEKSGFNAWNGASKSKNSGLLRPNFEAYIPIAKWIHIVFPNFFGFDALSKRERDNALPFNIHLPDGRVAKAIITQDNGKSLQTNPQSFLGEWILHDVLGLKARELLTMEHLYNLGVDSLKITKIDNSNFKIELAETYAYEGWKIDIYSEIEKYNIQKPIIRPELFDKIEE